MQKKIKAHALFKKDRPRRNQPDAVCYKGDSPSSNRVHRFLATKRLYNLRQTDDMDLGSYLEELEMLVSTAEKLGLISHVEENDTVQHHHGVETQG